MSVQLADEQIEHWQNLLQEMKADKEWTAMQKDRDSRRLVVQREMIDLLTRFLDGQIEVEELRQTYDRKTRTDWDVFGLKGMSGAMFLNQLVKHIPESAGLDEQLETTLRLPADVQTGRMRMHAFVDFQESMIESGQATRRQLQPARTPFFVSSWWHLQVTELWPIYYISGRRSLAAHATFVETGEAVRDYFAFRETFMGLSVTLGLKSWELEHLFSWLQERRHTSVEPTPPISPPPETPVGKDKKAGTNHAQVQWLLARLGRKLGCRVWIAANDHGRTWQDQPLGELSIKQLPSLGMDPDSEQIVRLIDVLWLKGRKQVVAAFEIEHTTSIYSGLLRMADLAALSPNLNFPLYIVAPEARLDKVRAELLRPTFQALELHERCGFFSSEALVQAAEEMIRWAGDPSVVDRLAQRVGSAGD